MLYEKIKRHENFRNSSQTKVVCSTLSLLTADETGTVISLSGLILVMDERRGLSSFGPVHDLSRCLVLIPAGVYACLSRAVSRCLC